MDETIGHLSEILEEVSKSISASTREAAAPSDNDKSSLLTVLQSFEHYVNSRNTIELNVRSECLEFLLAYLSICHLGGDVNEPTLKGWKLFSKLLPQYHIALNVDLAYGFMDLLLDYSLKGLGIVCASDQMLESSETIDELLREVTAVKLISFFVTRTATLTTYCAKKIEQLYATKISVVMLRYLFIAHRIVFFRADQDHYRNSCVAVVQPVIVALGGHLDITKHVLSSHCLQSTEAQQYLCHACYGMLGLLVVEMKSGYSGDLQKIEDSLHLTVYLLHHICIRYCGLSSDSSLVNIVNQFVDSIFEGLQQLQSEEMFIHITDLLICSSCQQYTSEAPDAVPQKSSLSYFSRLLLCRFVSQLSSEYQDWLAPWLWQRISDLLGGAQCSKRTCHYSSILDTMRALMLTMDPLHSFTLVSFILKYNESDNHCRFSSDLIERVVQHIPLAYIYCRGSEDIKSSILGIVKDAMFSIELYSGIKAPTTRVSSETRNVLFTDIGPLLTIIQSFSGVLLTNRALKSCLQVEQYRAQRSVVASNVSIGTALLRWISALSEHVSTVLPLQNSPSDGSNIHPNRIERACSINRTIQLICMCFGSNETLPRGVQTLLIKSASRCAELSKQVLRVVNSLTPSGNDDATRALLVNIAIESVTSAGMIMKSVSGPKFAESMMESAGEVFTTLCECSTTICDGERAHAERFARLLKPLSWIFTTLVLSTIQQFANVMPTAFRSRARELVTLPLIPVLQARANGQTHLLTAEQAVSSGNSSDWEDLCVNCFETIDRVCAPGKVSPQFIRGRGGRVDVGGDMKRRRVIDDSSDLGAVCSEEDSYNTAEQ